MRKRNGARYKRFVVFVNWGLLPTLLVLSSCVNLTKSNPVRQYYALDVTRQAESGVPVAGTVLEVRRLLVSPAFQGQELVYRTEDTRYESDFYNQWFVSPSAMLTQQVQNWLINAHLFENVVTTSSYMQATHRLEGTVTALYGDYRQKDRRKAVVGIHMVLIEDNPTRTAIVFQRDYHQNVEVTDTSPDGLTQAWNQGLEQVFIALEQDLRKIDWEANHQRR
jgi:cholesterol transport system auxiliary component